MNEYLHFSKASKNSARDGERASIASAGNKMHKNIEWGRL